MLTLIDVSSVLFERSNNENASIHEIRRGLIKPRLEILQDNNNIRLGLALPHSSVYTTLQVNISFKRNLKITNPLHIQIKLFYFIFMNLF